MSKSSSSEPVKLHLRVSNDMRVLNQLNKVLFINETINESSFS